MGPVEPSRSRVLGMRVDAGCGTVDRVLDWAQQRRSSYVCPLTTETVLRGCEDNVFRQIVNSADAVPCVDRWLGRWLVGGGCEFGVGDPAKRLLFELCGRAQESALPIGLYGRDGGQLDGLIALLLQRFPRLPVVCSMLAPPGGFSHRQDAAITRKLNASGARLLLVWLGSPGEEQWMLEHKGRVHAAMVGLSPLIQASLDTRPGAPGVTLDSFRPRLTWQAHATGWRWSWDRLRLGGRILAEAAARSREVSRRRPLPGAARVRR